MANYRAVIRSFPPALDYLRKASWIRRGDVLAYAPQVVTPRFTTDAFGFRHTRFFGRDLSIGNALEFAQVGLLLGSSHIFGFGLASNAETLPSRLSQTLKQPVFGISFPEADTRTLASVGQRLINELRGRLRLILLATGGDFTRFCYTGHCDATFGPPVLPRDERAPLAESRMPAFKSLLAFSSYWIEVLAASAGAAGVRFALIEDLTFFEKSGPDPLEADCQLGKGHDESFARRFELHRQRVYDFGDARRSHAFRAGIDLIRFPPQEQIRFIDEFHYRRESIVDIAEVIGSALAQEDGMRVGAVEPIRRT